MPRQKAKQQAEADMERVRVSCCTKSGQVLVERLHAIAIKAHTISLILLTLEMKGVKTQSFFDSF